MGLLIRTVTMCAACILEAEVHAGITHIFFEQRAVAAPALPAQPARADPVILMVPLAQWGEIWLASGLGRQVYKPP